MRHIFLVVFWYLKGVFLMKKNFFVLQRFAKKIKLTNKDDVYSNSEENRIVYALGGNDSIYNTGTGDYVTISGGKGDDTIKNYGGYVSVDGEAGNDYISSGYSVSFSYGYYYATLNGGTLNGGDGNDTISSYGRNAKIDGGDGDDKISSSGYNSTINGGDGNDSIYGHNSTINGGDGDDTISGSGIIDGGSGNDYISSYSKNNLIQYASGDGNDTILGFDSSDTLQITEGNFTTTKSGSDFIVKVGKQKIILKDSVKSKYDKIHIKNSAGKTVVYNDWKKWIGTSSDDSFVNYCDNVALYAKAGHDSISNYKSDVTIEGGTGDDTISSSGINAKIDGGKGDDKISSSGINAKIDGGTGDDTIENYGDYVSVDGGAGNDTISSYGINAKIDGGTGDDTISSSGINAKINGGAGNDYIRAYNGSGVSGSTVAYYATLNGGKGNDTINAEAVNIITNGGKGNDWINVHRADNTISGGKGNDSISLSSYAKNSLVQYATGDGKDIVLGFDSDDTLQITKGKYSVKTKGDDVVVSVGKGSITLKGMAGEKLSITNAKGKTTKKTYGKAVSNNSVSELWFDSENNIVQDDFESIIENKSDVAIEKFAGSEVTNLASKTSLTAGIDYDKN